MKTMKWDDIKQKKPPTPESRRLLAEARAEVAANSLWPTRQLGLHHEDPFISALEGYVKAFGGRLELRAVFEDESIVLNFAEPT